MTFTFYHVFFQNLAELISLRFRASVSALQEDGTNILSLIDQEYRVGCSCCDFVCKWRMEEGGREGRREGEKGEGGREKRSTNGEERHIKKWEEGI